ncbi:hypothetical protein JB92DRAFT_2200696 [Gautieria morchelliformis]|nr:hypothetical protein JB92DRAFT_2200696 [Gautieria morchelliformis]
MGCKRVNGQQCLTVERLVCPRPLVTICNVVVSLRSMWSMLNYGFQYIALRTCRFKVIRIESRNLYGT